MINLNRTKKFPYYFVNGIETLDKKRRDDLEKILKRAMSYEVQNAQRTDAYKTLKWDGREYLLFRPSGGSWYFPVGLLDIAKDIFDALGYEYTITDDTEVEEYGELFDWISKKKFYDFQDDAVDAVLDDIGAGGVGGIVSMPTGSGKTLVMLKVIYLLQQPTLILVRSKELLYQWRDVIRETLGVEPGIVGDGNEMWNDSITIAMVQTLYSKMKNGIERALSFNLLAVDECHSIPADTTYTVAMRCSSRVRIGASATPVRIDGAELKMYASIGRVSYNIHPVELIKRGIIAKPEFRFCSVPATSIRARKWNQVRLDGIVANRVRNEIIVEQVERLYKEGHSIYVAVDLIDHGQILEEMISSKGISTVFLSGSDKSDVRKEIILQFQNGDIKVIVSTLLKEGVDIPEISAYVAASGGKSEVATIQKVGRALRKKSGMNSAVVVDFRDVAHKFLSDHWEMRYNTYKMYYGEYVN